MLKFYSLCFVLFFSFKGKTQNNQVVYENNEFKISWQKYDSAYSFFNIERYHDESHHFGIVQIVGDTLYFHENVDTLLLIDPRVYYDYDESISPNEVKFESRMSYFNAPEWKSREDSIWYVINDSISYKYDFNFYSDVQNHPAIADISLDSFDLKIRTAYMESNVIPIDLRIKKYYKNFHEVKTVQNKFNSVVIRIRIVGTMPLPGLSFESYAPDKIEFNGKEYYFKPLWMNYH